MSIGDYLVSWMVAAIFAIWGGRMLYLLWRWTR